MSSNFRVASAARAFYGEPQHETASGTDPERVGVTDPFDRRERPPYECARTVRAR